MFSCDREFMYSYLISECDKQNAIDKIPDIWVNMQEEDFVPSEKLKIQMANSLESKGFSVPFDIPNLSNSTTSPEPSKNIEISNEKDGVSIHTGKEDTEIKINDLLEGEIHQKDIDSVLKRHKYLLETNQMTKKSEQKVAKLVSSLEDKNKQTEVLQIIFGDKAFEEFAVRYKNQFHGIVYNLNKVQLEAFIKDVSSIRILRTFRLDQKLAHVCIDDDLVGYVKSLESLDANSYIPSAPILRKVITENSENTAKLFEISSQLITTKPKFAANTMRACFMTGDNSDVANRLWMMLKDEGLDKLGKDLLLEVQKLPEITDQIKEDVSSALKGIKNKK
jgi:hypothetical protein